MTNDEEARSQDKYFSTGPNISGTRNSVSHRQELIPSRRVRVPKPKSTKHELAPITGVAGYLFSLRGTLGK
jgi:hypothetical protein